MRNSMKHGRRVQCPDCIPFHGRMICENMDYSDIPECTALDSEFDEIIEPLMVEDHFNHLFEMSAAA